MSDTIKLKCPHCKCIMRIGIVDGETKIIEYKSPKPKEDDTKENSTNDDSNNESIAERILKGGRKWVTGDDDE